MVLNTEPRDRESSDLPTRLDLTTRLNQLFFNDIILYNAIKNYNKINNSKAISKFLKKVKLKFSSITILLHFHNAFRNSSNAKILFFYEFQLS